MFKKARCIIARWLESAAQWLVVLIVFIMCISIAVSVYCWMRRMLEDEPPRRQRSKWLSRDPR